MTKKKLPLLRTDEEAERFVDEADLSEYDLSELLPMKFELRAKDKSVTLRMPEPLLDAVKARAAEKGVPYQRYIRAVLEASLGKPAA
ncbi:MAG: BrnA antitoxin family protein [Pseudomonadota bacterium]